MARVAIVEDSPDYRASLQEFLDLAAGFCAAAVFGSAEALLHAAARATDAREWDLILLDLELPGIGGLAALPEIKRLLPDVPVVILTVFEEPATVLKAITAGADGYLLKRTGARELLAQLDAVLAGGAPLTAGVARTILALLRDGSTSGEPVSATGPRRLDLTDREQAVLRCLVAGSGYKGAAAELEISVETVRSHIKSIYRKLQVHCVAEAVAIAIRKGLL